MRNKLILGINDKSELLQKRGFLLIDDGPLIDLCLSRYPRVVEFDVKKDSLNPLHGIDYRRARDLASVFYGSEGKDTLTVRNGKRALTRALLSAKKLDELEFGKGDDDKEAKALMDDLLLSPILRSVLCGDRQFSFAKGGSYVARLNRAELGEFDAFVLGSLLVQQFKGQVIIPDFGFYARDFHASLIRQKRLAIGVNCLAELEPKMRQMVLLMETKVGRSCSYEDAEALALYDGLVPHTNEYNDFVHRVMS